jgi:hypothetical protein
MQDQYKKRAKQESSTVGHVNHSRFFSSLVSVGSHQKDINTSNRIAEFKT